MAFHYLTWKFKCLAILRDICGLMAVLRRQPPPSSSAVMVVRSRRRPSSSAVPNDLWHRPVNHSASPSAQLTHHRRCPEPTPGAEKTSITSLSAIFSSLDSRYPSRDGHLSPSSTRASQPYTACKLTVPPWMAFFSQAYANEFEVWTYHLLWWIRPI